MRATIPSEISRLRRQLTQLARRLRQEARNDAESWTRMLVVSAIDRLGSDATPSAVGRTEDMRSSQVAAVLHDLEASGLLERVPDTADRRMTRLKLTATGKEILAESRRRRDVWLMDAMETQLTADECQLLFQGGELLERLTTRG